MFGRNILFYLRETPLGGEETVVSHVIVHCRDFAYQTMVVLGPESMVEIRLITNALSGVMFRIRPK